MDKKPKRPRDVSQLAKMMVDIASGETEGSSKKTIQAKTSKIKKRKKLN